MSTANLATTEIAANFKEILREKILLTFMNVIPPEQMDAMIASEVKAFFETERLLTIETTTVTIDNPQYETRSTSSWNNEKYLKREALAFGSKMTPFRQLVWSVLHQYLAPLLTEQLQDQTTELHSSLKQWVTVPVARVIGETHQDMFSNLARAMSQTMFKTTLETALNASSVHLKMALQQVGIDYNAVQSVPHALVPFPNVP